MYHALPSPQSNKNPLNRALALGLLLLLGALLFAYYAAGRQQAEAASFATATLSGGLSFSYQATTSDLAVDWQGEGDFNPHGKCPPDFFSGGFVLLCKKLADGACFRFLYHKGKKLLYRIDYEVVDGRARVGLHWVEGTHFGARYRIADDSFKGGRTALAPDGKGGVEPRQFQYGEPVSKKRSVPGRELFRETHITPGDCPEWWDIVNFIP